VTNKLPVKQDVSALTGFRGICALWVFFYHLHETYAAPGSPVTFIGQLLAMGKLGVPCFFLLSGFILSYVYADSFIKVDRASYLNFMIKRIARIWPLHIVTTLMLVVIVVIIGPSVEKVGIYDNFNLKYLPQNIFLMQYWGYPGYYTWNTPAWSVSQEFAFYLMFPFAIGLIKKITKHQRLSICLMLCGLPICISVGEIIRLLKLGSGAPPYLLLWTNFGVFLIGSMLYFVSANIKPRRIATSLISAMTILWALSPLTPQWPLIFPLCSMAMIALLYIDENPRSIWNNNVLKYFGDISYSIYLNHWIFIMTLNCIGVNKWLSPSGLFETMLIYIGYFAAVLVLSHFTYSFIEKPARRLLLQKLQS
jgi:peptidoglycan/LPS O-acetylase OafA/YrhL